MRKGIILAGGSGSRLWPATLVVSKQLLPIYDKPMIYYPLTTLMFAGIKDILLISTPKYLPSFEELLGDGSWLGLNIKYASQPLPNGLAQSLIIGEKFLNGDPSTLILGDNIFYGHLLHDKLSLVDKTTRGATIFAHRVTDPERYGVVHFNEEGKAICLEEKPTVSKSNFAVTGLYFFDEHAPSYAKQIKPSSRGELEITDLNKIYLEKDQLNVITLGRGYSWFDTGTHESLIEANLFVQTIQRRQGLKIACPEEIALNQDWIQKNDLKKLINLGNYNNDYRKYLMNLIKA